MTAPLATVATTLVTGSSPGARERCIASHLSIGQRNALLLEGLPDGSSLLSPSETLLVHYVAPACLCCTGNLILRVTLNRLLRARPDRLFIGVASTGHLDQLRSWLQHPPYDQLLELTPDLFAT